MISVAVASVAPVGGALGPARASTGIGHAPGARGAHRAIWAIAGLALIGAAVVVGGWGWWLLALLLAPDVSLIFGAGAGLVPGQLHPRAVPAYNYAHGVIWPAAAIIAGLAVDTAGQGFAILVVGLVWAAHVALDRAAGYGLRTPAGFQR